VIPSIATGTLSLQRYELLSPPQFVGWENYTKLFTNDAVFAAALRFTGNLVFWRVAAVAVVPLLLAWSLRESRRRLRIGVRLLFTIPLALIAPLPLLIHWKVAVGAWLGQTDSTRLVLSALDGLITFVIACGVGLILYGAVFRKAKAARSSVLLGALVCWVCFVLAAIALALQSMTPSLVVTSGGPQYTTFTLGLWHYLNAFQYFRFGYAATVSTLLLITVGMLGMIAGIVLIASNLGLTVVVEEQPADAAHTGRLGTRIAVFLVVLIALAICLIGLLPLLQGLLQSDTGTETVMLEVSHLRLWRNTLVPSLISVVIQLTVSTLAAFGIGALRPFGRRSEWLLLLFSPWLFTTVLPLSQAFFEERRQSGLLNTLSGNIHPILVNVPILFLLTLFYKGCERQYQKEQTEQNQTGQDQAAGRTLRFFSALLLPSLPLVLLAGTALWLITMQGLYWPMLVSPAIENFSWPQMLYHQQGNGFAGIAGSIRAFQLPLIGVTMLVLGVYHRFFLDRLTVTTSHR
jgi:ABC-type sugar transport system permease subunit